MSSSHSFSFSPSLAFVVPITETEPNKYTKANKKKNRKDDRFVGSCL